MLHLEDPGFQGLGLPSCIGRGPFRFDSGGHGSDRVLGFWVWGCIVLGDELNRILFEKVFGFLGVYNVLRGLSQSLRQGKIDRPGFLGGVGGA